MSDQSQTSGQPLNPVDSEQKQDVVKYDTYQKVLNEKKKRDEELRKANEQISAFEQERKNIQEQSLREKEDFKKLFESRDGELKQTQTQLSQLQESINNSKKMSSFLGLLGESLEQPYWNLVDLDKIAIDPTTGKPDEQVSKQYAEEFRKTHWKLFDVAGGARMPNHVAGPVKSQGLTKEQWLKLPYNEQKKRMNDIID
jgi:hypothetical protein